MASGFGKYPDSPLFVAPWGNGAAQSALFRGFFNGEPENPGSDLLLEAMEIPFPEGVGPAVFRVLLSTAPTDESKRVLVVGGADGSIGFVFRLIGVAPATWEQAGATVRGAVDALTKPNVTGLLGDWAAGVAFSEVNSNAIVIGWQSAYFLSTDYGSNWTQVDASSSPNIHPGVHAIQFTDELTSPQRSLMIATDGGLFTTTDRGHTHSSAANQTFPNLKFANGALDNHIIGIVTGSLSNNLNIYASAYGVPQLWQPLRANDVGPVAFLRNGILLDYDSLQPTNASSLQSVLQGRRLDPFNRPPGYLTQVDPIVFNDVVTSPGSGGTIDASINLRPLGPVDIPSSVDINSDSLVAVAGRQFEVCGVILSRQDALHENAVVHVLGSPTANEIITAVSSPDGQSTIVGTDEGNIFTGTPVPGADSFSFSSAAMPFLMPSSQIARPITKISARKGSRIFAIAKGTQFLRLEGSGWDHISHPHVLEDWTGLLAVPSESSLFLACSSKIFQSHDDGSTWVDISAGLPASAHITDLQHIKEPGGASILYIFTDGWSVFRRFLNQPPVTSQRAVTVKGVMGITYDDNTANFAIPAGGVRMEDSWALIIVLKYLNTNGNEKVFADITIRATYREDESVEVVSELWLGNFWSGQNLKNKGTTVVLDPGSSYYQNVNVTLGGGRGDTDGGVVDVDFLVTNWQYLFCLSFHFLRYLVEFDFFIQDTC